jgi:predicted nucleic acid-binding protein
VIVLDASAAVELILETDTGGRVAARLRGESIHAPAHLDVEVVSAIRRSVNHEVITDRDGLVAVADFLAVPMRRWTVPPFVERAYELRDTHPFADAVYIALAEALDSPLLTTDERLARSHGHGATVEVP